MDPSQKFVKLETYDIESESVLPNGLSAMHHNNHYGTAAGAPPNFHESSGSQRSYMDYQTYVHANNADSSHNMNQHNAQMQGYHHNNMVKYEQSQPSTVYDANNGAAFSFVDARSGETNEQATDPDLPVIVNGKYFKIIEELNATEHQRVQRGIIAMCQLCPRDRARSVQGSLRITSNFVRHLKTMHPTKYEEFIIERQTQKRKPGRKRKSSQFDDHTTNNGGSGSRTDGYTDEDTMAQSPEGAGVSGAYYDDNAHASSANNADNADLYSPDSNDTHETDESGEKKLMVGNNQTHCDPNEIPTILNGKYFKIIEYMQDANRASNSVVAACQFCESDKLVKGPLKVTSNFVQHLRNHHFKEYNMYLQEKFNSSTRCRRLLNRHHTAQLSFLEKVMNFILVANVPVSVAEEPTFVELFFGTGITMCSTAQLLARLDEMHGIFIEQIRLSLQVVPYICASADIWHSRKKHYFGYCCFWLDNCLKRQMAMLACVRLSDEPNYNELEALIRQIHSKYGINEERITCVITDGMQDFVQTYHNFSMESICDNSSDEDFHFTPNNKQHLLDQLPKHTKRAGDSLNLLTVLDFSKILHSNETLNNALKRALHMLNKCKELDADVLPLGNLFDGCVTTNSDTRWTTWYTSLAHLTKNKNKIDEICTYLNIDRFIGNEIEHLEEFCMLLKPIADALEFLQQDAYLYYGYYLPTIVTIKVKLKKLKDSRQIKHLRALVQQMSDALFTRLRKYFEMKAECNDAIIAAIACPAIKMRFVEALRETAPHVTTESLTQLFIDYAQEFYEDNSKKGEEKGSGGDVREQQRPPSVDSFLCFTPEENEDLPTENKPNVSIRKELTNYLNDEDKTLACLNRYPLVRKVFEKYNTAPPSTVTLANFYQTFLNVFEGQRCGSGGGGQQLADEHLERLILVKANKLF